MTAAPAIHRQLRIHGLVQGVYYRASLVKQAEALGLAGWVRNRHDGSVEALVSGPAEAVERLIAWAHSGPPAARVSRVDIGEAAEAAEATDAPKATEASAPGEAPRRFVQRPTA